MYERLPARALCAALIAAAALLAAPAAQAHPKEGPDVVVEWNQATLDLLATPGVQPITVHPTRTLTLVHVAMHDAVDAIRGGYEPYLIREDAPRDANATAAAVAAAHTVLSTLYPAQKATFDARRQQDLGQLPDTLSTRLGIATGEYAGEKIVAAAADDGTAATPPLVPPATQPGEWRPTPPAFTAGLYTHYPQVRPFVLK